MTDRVVVLGAGFGGLEFSTLLSEELGDGIDVTLNDKSDGFVFGFSKLDIDPEARRVTTDAGVPEADVLVVALGADYDLGATAIRRAGRQEGALRREPARALVRGFAAQPDRLAAAIRQPTINARRDSP